MDSNTTQDRPVAGVILATAIILSVPLLAMQVTDEVSWGLADFVVAAVLLAGTGVLFTRAVRRTGEIVYRVAVGVALGAALMLVWATLAVGLIGSEDNAANLMYAGVLAVGVAGASIARLRPRGMARAMLATGLAQVMVAATALIAGLGSPVTGPLEILAGNGLFVALWVGSALLFRSAARP